MKIFDVMTKRGDVLYGCLYGENFRDTCVIITNGNCGNIFDNKFLRDMGEQLEREGISFIYAHNSGAFHRMDSPSSSGKILGNTYELFDDCIQDLQAFVDYAKSSGFKKIVLGGHSYGTNKVVYYLSENQEEDIDSYILLSPTDTTVLKDHERVSAEKLMPIALKMKEEGKLDELIPIPFDDWNLYTARAFLDFIENPHSKNLPIYSNGDFKQLKKIRQRGLFVMGEKDGFAFNDTAKHLQIIKENAKNKDSAYKVVEGCGHVFRGGEAELAQIVLDFVK